MNHLVSLMLSIEENFWLYLEEMRTKFEFSTIMVTHDVEEAVFLSDTLVIMHGYPGSVKETIDVDIPHPRTNKYSK